MVRSGGQAVPKFSSFQPRKRSIISNITRSQQDSKGDNNQKAESSKDRVDKPEGKSRSRHHGGDATRGCRSHRRTEHRDRSPIRPTDRRHPGKATSNDSKSHKDRSNRRIDERSSPAFQITDSYIIDTKGDPANLQYRNSNRWTVPLYRLYGSGSIVGLHPDVKIDRKLSDDRGYTLMYPAKSQPRVMADFDDLWEPRNTAKAKTEHSVTQKDQPASEIEEDFILMPKEHNESMCSKYLSVIQL